MTTSFLYFDLGNVLLKFNNERAIRQVADLTGADHDQLAALMAGEREQDGLQWRFEAGEFSDDEFFEIVCREFSIAPDRAAFEVAASDMFEPIAESFALIPQLKAAGHRLGILSNTNAIHWRFLLDGRFAVLNDQFAEYVTSFDAQSMKPDRRIYDVAIEQAGVPASEVFFVDDKLVNVEGALAAGLDAVQYIGHEQLLFDLAARGIEVPC
ncbi:HAD family hydrolase [Aeoliella mucimassa]|uniref:Alpha-D-glucose-1-phosphate phosphatase YihX n=1 Tax=Aeoliella mucimassa TaxID=2527972 RepID=A0A518AJQ1_9BACT|nr:HAD family phosphatase [Aeoliella mucimassa]QDU54952.1 Alpha-D-glucose-1-phosphate phosphatase YihX [Aeoliella mucimassa]